MNPIISPYPYSNLAAGVCSSAEEAASLLISYTPVQFRR
jgi:hypothetical protein